MLEYDTIFVNLKSIYCCDIPFYVNYL